MMRIVFEFYITWFYIWYHGRVFVIVDNTLSSADVGIIIVWLIVESAMIFQKMLVFFLVAQRDGENFELAQG